MKTLLAAVLTTAVAWPIVAGPADPAPWEIWDDPSLLPRLPAGDLVLLRSSHCPDGCRFDRHSKGDSRFIRMDGNEGVIFEDVGPGAITRIWMTQGDGDSLPLNPKIGLRIYLDGEETPHIDMPLADFFSGKTAPFLTPMAGNHLVSSGGNYNYVPIPYREGCRVSLVNAEEERIWFQVTYHRLSSPEGVTTFTGKEDLSRWRELLGSTGTDPWLDDGVAETVSGTVGVAAGESATLFEPTGVGLISGLRLEAPESAWDDLRLVLEFDGRKTADLTLRDAFAYSRGGLLPTRSLLVGLDELDRFYLYFPMPYFENARVRVVSTAADGDPVDVDYWVRRSTRLAEAGSGHFGIQLQEAGPTVPGFEALLFELKGYGKWVGLFSDMATVDSLSQQYLEGDEKIYLDGARHPAHYGTGTEDIFNGGFYFDFGPFRQALHGMTFQTKMPGERATGAYRLLLTDAPTFGSSIRAGLETGPTGEMPMRTRTVSYYYVRHDPVLARRDVLDLADPESRASHIHAILGDFEIQTLDASFESQPPVMLTADGYYRQQGKTSFVMATEGCLGQPRVRRLLDAGLSGQAATVELDSVAAGTMPPIDANVDLPWREVDIDLDAPINGDSATVEIIYDDGTFPVPLVGDAMTEFLFEFWCLVNQSIFGDGFESGDLSGWSSSAPL